jgi:hypothetical protein
MPLLLKEFYVGQTTSLRAVRMWLLLSLALPVNHPGRDRLIDQSATVFAQAFAAAKVAKPRRTSLGPVAEA